MAGEISKPAVSSFTCESCGAAVEIRAQGLTVTAVCSHCGAVSDIENDNFKLVKKSHGLMNIKPLIPLGKKGKLRGQVVQLIGFMRRFDSGYPSEPWDEYLLFNPFTGYCWLAESKGHWTIYRVTKSSPKQGNGQLSFLGDTYKFYHHGTAVVQFVIGEFYWRVRVGDTADTIDAICPPHILSKEQTTDELIWSLGEYLEPQEIENAFHPEHLPPREGVAPNQPSASRTIGDIWITWFFAFIALLMIQKLENSSHSTVFIAGDRVTVTGAGVTDAEILRFTSDKKSTHVSLNVTTSINQSWASIGLRLVSEDPNNSTNHVFEKDLSFYSGYDDGYWSEGSPREEFLINRLPAGHYRVLLTAIPEAKHSVDISTSVAIAPPIWSNFWLFFFIITLPPAVLTFFSSSFERRRWSDSEFNPFERSQSNDE